MPCDLKFLYFCTADGITVVYCDFFCTCMRKWHYFHFLFNKNDFFREALHLQLEPIKDNGLEDWPCLVSGATCGQSLFPFVPEYICCQTSHYKDFYALAAKSVAHTTVKLAGGFVNKSP